MIVRQLGARVASISSSVASVANKGVVASIVVNDTADTLDTSNTRRCFYSTTTNNSSSMSIPTHMSPLVLVKSIRVPRPIKPKYKVRNKLKDRIELDTIVEQSKVMKVDEANAHLSYVGNVQIPITNKLKIVLPEEDVPSGVWPVFRMMDETGNFHGSTNPTKIIPERFDLSQLQSALILQHPNFVEQFQSSTLLQPSKHDYADTKSTNTLLRAHRQMIRLRKMDTILQDVHRQGRISFYMTCTGEEAIHMGSASALQPQDFIFAQYREAGMLMWRGFSLDQFCNQCFSNDLDLGRGRQMPIHYGCRALNYQTVSSPLGTQITQAVGASYKFKLDAIANPEKETAISIVYFGEGAASTIDFHSACNFAATLKVPMIFFCRNNGYAISTPVEDQYAGDGIVSRAPGYGMAAIRVDGNDLFAVHAAVAQARKLALETSSPVMIEAMTYRGGHHSTSDDSSRYRDTKEVETAKEVSDPFVRFNRFLKQFGWMSDEDIASIEDEERQSVLDAMKKAESRPKPNISTMFEDVYHEKPPSLVRQEQDLLRHLKKFKISQEGDIV